MTATPEPVSAEDAARVYAIVEALRTKDIETIRPHVGYRQIACATRPTAGVSPKCANDENDGDQIDAFYYATCEGQYLRPLDIEQPLDALTNMEVYDAYRVPKKRDSGYEYSIVLIDHDSSREGYAWEAIVDNGEMIGLLFSCSLSAEELIAARHYAAPVPTPEPTSSATPAP